MLLPTASLPLHLRLVHDPLGALSGAASAGDAVLFRRPNGPLVSLAHPELVLALLREGGRPDWGLADGLVEEEIEVGDAVSAAVSEVAPRMIELARDRFGKLPLGPRDLLMDAGRVAFEVAFAAILGDPHGVRAREVRIALGDALDRARRWTPFGDPDARRVEVRAQVLGLIRRALDTRSAANPGLSGLLTAESAADTVLGWLVDAYEVTPLGLAWTADLLGRHAGIQAQVRSEVGRHGVPTTVAALGQLPWLLASLDEAVRLYPPVFGVGRTVAEAVELQVEGQSVAVEAGARFLATPWVLHRDPRWWDDAPGFRPQRWFGAEPRPGTYLPYGALATGSVGSALARLESAVVLAVLIERAELTSESEAPKVYAGHTLRPVGGMRITQRPAPMIRFR